MKLPRFALLTFLLAGVALTGARGATPFRLFELAVTRFTPTTEGRARLELGHLNAKGELRVMESYDVATPPRTGPEAFGQILVSSEAWTAFQSLGAQAVANFERVNQGLPVVVAGIPHYVVAARPDANVAVGAVVNLSTRGLVGPGGTETLIGGFVIEGHARRVLLRGIGPSLAQFGVDSPVADPLLVVRRGQLPYHENGDWGARFEADEIARVAVQVGAFPLERGSRDAAVLVELPPGAYTAAVRNQSASGTGGTALLEIYILP